MTKKTPLQIVNEQHGGKEKLVDALVGMLERGEEGKADFRARLLAAANSKLLRLHRTMTEIKDRFGGEREKAIDALLGLMNKSKDKDYREKLFEHSPVRLLSMLRAAEKRHKKQQKVA